MRKLMTITLLLALAVAFVPVRAAANDDPQQPKTMATMSLADLEARGDLARVRKDYRLAMDFYNAALKRDRSNSLFYTKIGMCQLLMGDYRAAQSNFEKAAKRKPNDAIALNNIGGAAYFLKNYGKAVKYYKKALALDEANATFHNNLAAAWFSQKNYERAMIEYQRALELDPEILLRNERGGISAQIRPEDRANYAFMVAKLYAKRGDLEHCLEFLRKAKEEGYNKLLDVYTTEEFASLRQDPRLAELIPPPMPKR